MIYNSQIAVYGFGPASIFFLEKFVNTNVTINVYEYGKENNETEINTIDEIKGPIEFFKGSNRERIGGFFGTAGLWREKGVGGKFFKFDKNDIILNNWPISYEELNNYYQLIINKFDQVFKLSINNDLNIKKKFFDETNFEIKKGSQTLTYNFDRVIKYYKKKINNSKNIKIYYEHPLVNFELDKNNNKILRGRVLNNDKIIESHSEYHILSSGCLESNKIILETLKEHQSYIENKKIGRRLSFHPSCALGSFFSDKMITRNFLKRKIDFKREIICLKNKDAAEIYNSGAFLSFEQKNEKKLLSKIYNKLVGQIYEIKASLAFEHFASDLNYIKLSNKKDINGIRKININTSFCDLNKKFAESKYQNFISKLTQLKIFNYNFYKKEFLLNLETNNHHHGGLIFSNKFSDPVDDNLNFRGLKNLYINGSSVFPSSSIYNPTFTIIALSKRLSEFIYKNFYKSL